KTSLHVETGGAQISLLLAALAHELGNPLPILRAGRLEILRRVELAMNRLQALEVLPALEDQPGAEAGQRQPHKQRGQKPQSDALAAVHSPASLKPPADASGPSQKPRNSPRKFIPEAAPSRPTPYTAQQITR